MTQNDVLPSDADPAWWKAPLGATVPALPLLVWEFVIGAEEALGLLGGAVYWAVGLLALAWALPHRRSARMLRVTAACAGLFCAILPLLFLVWMAMVWSSA
ncbi:hypothetical protein [Streptomyces sp. HD]|uniref:hypothetical protein n=1 Tax=Streptomyces sp. HD TaxID=3020892 RepID=UPI00232D24B9|nr:hypothetical protein [Streptomyces sp. HD]MDC0770414.1 hypothetical protein [Streptomyces sp. HD]